jgi:hypothetical protein
MNSSFGSGPCGFKYKPLLPSVDIEGSSCPVCPLGEQKFDGRRPFGGDEIELGDLSPVCKAATRRLTDCIRDPHMLPSHFLYSMIKQLGEVKTNPFMVTEIYCLKLK